MRLNNGKLTLGWIGFTILCLTGPMLRPLSADDLEFPYTALVLKQQTLVRSGPDAMHYPTETLSAGDTVQVHRHDPGGWAAIRPTPDSFSLIPAAAVELLDDRTGRIKESGTQAWVGTMEGAVDAPLWQVKLKQNERIEILGEVSWPDPEGHSTIWYQVSPPAGEFRWIKLSNLQVPKTDLKNLSDKESIALDDLVSQLSNPENAANLDELSNLTLPDQANRPSVDMATQQSATPGRSEPGSDSQIKPAAFEGPTNTPQSDTDNAGWRAATHKIDRFSSSEVAGQFTSDPAKSPTPERFSAPQFAMDARANDIRQDARQTPNRPAQISRIQPEQFHSNSTQPKSIITEVQPQLPVLSDFPTGPLGDQLNNLDYRLTLEMSKPPATWRLEDMKIKTQQIFQNANSEANRRYAERLLQKLAGCEQLRNRYRQTFNSDPGANTILGNLTSSNPVGSGVETNVEFGTTYDAYGWLNELKQDNGTREPTFVLKNDQGKITHHISPTPGLNLRRYLKTKVGIIGSRGYHQGYHLDHVTAQRIVELNKLR